MARRSLWVLGLMAVLGCGANLAPGAAGSGASCTAPPAGARLLSPISGSVLTSTEPSLSFVPGRDGTDVEICADRACANPAWEATVTGNHAAPNAPLSAGYWFWRIRPAGQEGGWTSSWLFRVRRDPWIWSSQNGPAAATAGELFSDYDGDGYPDLAVSNPTEVTIYLGGPNGPSADRVLHPNAIPGATGQFGPPNVDLNGDGFTDFATMNGTLTVQLGGPGGLGAPANQVSVGDGAYPDPFGVGDVDGDGYADLVVPARTDGLLIHGCASGPPHQPWMKLLCADCQMLAIASGDLNGDGRWDVAFGDTSATTVYLGAPSPTPVAFPGAAQAEIIDLDWDGYSDLVASTDDDYAWVDFPGEPGGPSPSSSMPLDTMRVGGWPALPRTADFNGDGAWDLLDVGDQSGTVWFGSRQAPSTFPSQANLPAVASGTELVAGIALDMNGDGYDDAVVSLKSGGLLYVAGSPDGISSTAVIVPPP